jgi:hypothetical protein
MYNLEECIKISNMCALWPGNFWDLFSPKEISMQKCQSKYVSSALFYNIDKLDILQWA